MAYKFRVKKSTRTRIAGLGELAITAARRNPVADTVMTVRDYASPIYKIASGRNPLSIRELLNSRQGRPHPHPPDCMCPFHGGRYVRGTRYRVRAEYRP
jgi:hypothetical protein